jgi:hypothetical protein
MCLRCAEIVPSQIAPADVEAPPGLDTERGFDATQHDNRNRLDLATDDAYDRRTSPRRAL